MTADVETAPVIGLRRNGRRLERPHRRPFIRLGALRKRQRDQHAAANEPTPNEPMPHQAPRYPVCLFAPTQAAPSRSPASRRGTQAERKNYAELVTIVQNAGGGGRVGSTAAVNTRGGVLGDLVSRSVFFCRCWCQSVTTSVANDGVERVMAERVSSGKCKGPAGGTAGRA